MSKLDFQNGLAIGLAVKLSAFTPTKSPVEKLYEHYGVDKTEYPYVFFGWYKTKGYSYLRFVQKASEKTIGSTKGKILFKNNENNNLATFPDDFNDGDAVVTFIIDTVSKPLAEGTGKVDDITSSAYAVWTNAEVYKGSGYNDVYYLV